MVPYSSQRLQPVRHLSDFVAQRAEVACDDFPHADRIVDDQDRGLTGDPPLVRGCGWVAAGAKPAGHACRVQREDRLAIDREARPRDDRVTCQKWPERPEYQLASPFDR